MELPIDHFQLIGVSPSATPEEILRAFQLRLDKTPQEGFTFEVLTQRSELLRLTADLLTNSDTRKEYENLVLKGASGLELSSSREVAGLILLWESGSSKEAFKLARNALQPPQTPALGSGRESDLTLLAALASRDAAIQEQDQRRFANAADFLQEGIQILQRMGKLSDLRKSLEEDLNSLLPFRILDFLSRDLSEYESHKKGLNMLENLIFKRGGLEGKNKSEYDKYFNQQDFEVFFQQVKPFLTVQEQIDLFSNLQRRGSIEAGFLCFLALTALGFSQRKPEKLFEARKILKNLNFSGLDSMPLMGCIDLLLADVKQAEARFYSSSDENLKDWLNNYPSEKLEALCLYCKNWLENDVLRGYRDINIDNVDLDPWFEDREIQEFIEKIEKRSNRGISKNTFQGVNQNKSNLIEDQLNNLLNQKDAIQDESNLPIPGGFKEEEEEKKEDANIIKDEFLKNKSSELYKYLFEKYAEIRFYLEDSLKNKQLFFSSSYIVYVYAFLILFTLGLGIGFVRKNIRNSLVEETSLKASKGIEENGKIQKQELLKVKSNELSNNSVDNDILVFKVKDLNSASPSLDEIKYLLNTWLTNKSQFLEGKGTVNLSKIVKEDLIKRLYEERDMDIKKNIIQKINTKIKSIELISQSASRIVVSVKLDYSEKIINTSGELLNETSFAPFLKVKYILGFSDKSWKLVDYVSGN